MAQAAGDLGIDLGTSNVVIYMKGRGVIFREPSVVAVDRETNNIIAFGTEAYRMIGRAPSNVSIIRPLAQGEMIDFDLTNSMLRYYITNITGKRFLARPRAVMAVPSGVKEMEKKALVSAMFDAGLRRTQLLDRTIAAALGAQLNFLGSYGSLVADMSAGGTDLAVLCNSAVTVMSSVPVGGDHFDDSVIRYLRKKHNLLIGERTAEQVKMTLGGAVRRNPKVVMDVTGRNLISGLPKTLAIDSDEIYEALVDNVNELIEGVQVVIERTPPQLVSDIFEGGLTLTGGASGLYGLAERISDVLKIPCHVAQDAKDCVVLGCAKVLMNPAGMRHLLERG
ncbi:rod shape-determining protein [Clostridiales bacterium]|nr:rod shape-determining protein [Clostridiales bacterium]